MLILVAPLIGASPVAAQDVSKESAAFFENEVRPLLAENCYKCHGPDKQKGELRLDSLAGMLTGGELGAVLVPGQADKSLIIQAISYADADLQMPPKVKLPQRAIDTLTRWVAMGAPWPNATAQVRPAPAENVPSISDADRAYWAFVKVQRPAAPAVSDDAWPVNPIDRFVLAQLEAKGATHSEAASPRELIRRVYFDLIGLPPTPQEVAAFEADHSDRAYEAMVDRLLAMPQYGERWARHWLDIVRYAQSNGYERDNAKPLIWRYRDYVIQSFNEDKPYQRFVMEQLAGDELPDRNADSLVATGYYRLGVWDDEPDDKRMAEFDALDDIVHVTGTTFLGLTVGCARCHAHKFDPISQEDYYSFVAFFHNVRQYENPRFSLDSPTLQPMIEFDRAKQWQADKDGRVADLKGQIEAIRKPVRTRLTDQKLAQLSDDERLAYDTAGDQRTPEQKKLAQEANKKVKVSDDEIRKSLDEAAMAKLESLEKQLGEAAGQKPPWEWALAVTEHGTQVPETHVLIRGNAGTPGDEVKPRFMEVLGGGEPQVPPRKQGDRTNGLRLALAKWMTRADNPMTARVMANRIWQHHFGTGIVATPNDFGKAGVMPTNQPLLDYLAAEFVDGGWSMKHLHKLIVLSRTYRQTSRNDNEKALAVDPANMLYWRQNMRRLEAEAIRDSVLAVSGSLNLDMAGESFFPRLAGEVVAGASRPGAGWGHSTQAQRNRRSIYMFVKRTMLVPLMESFDYIGTESPIGARPVTTISPQALMLLNSHFIRDQAQALADRLISEVGSDPQAQIERGYEIALGRKPTSHERKTALAFFDRQKSAFAENVGELSFRPDAADALEGGYLSGIKAEDLLEGPRDGWTYTKGPWGGGYSGIMNLDEDRGPCALWNCESFADGTVQTRINLARSARFAGIIVRGQTKGDLQTGYEVRFNPSQKTIALLRHDEKEMKTLAQADWPGLNTERWHTVRIETLGPRIRAWVDGGNVPMLDVTDAEPIVEAGHVGVRARGGPVTLDDLTVTSNQKRFAVAEYVSDTQHHQLDVDAIAHRKALRSLCVLILNLNEFVYVD